MQHIRHVLDIYKVIQSMLIVAVLCLICTGCSSGDDPATVALIKKHIPVGLIQTSKDNDGVEHIVGLGIKIQRKNRTVMLDLLPQLNKLRYLESLGIGGDELQGYDLKNNDLKSLPPLPKLKKFSISSNSPKLPSSFSDDGLKYLSGMTGLNELSLRRTNVRGPGLAYLKGFKQLKRLDLGSTPLDDSAMPHVAANFPRLKRFDFANTNVTFEGVMKLVNLHWLNKINMSDNIAVPLHLREKKGVNRWEFEKPLIINFGKAHLALKRKARANGLDVPEDRCCPLNYMNWIGQLESKIVQPIPTGVLP